MNVSDLYLHGQISAFLNSPSSKEPATQAQAQELLTRLQKSKLSDLGTIESAQHGLEVRRSLFTFEHTRRYMS